MKQNEIRIGTNELELRNPTDHEIARIRGLFAKIMRRKPQILISGIFMEIGEAIYSRRALVVGSHYCTIAHGSAEARVRVSEGQNVVVTFG